MPRLQIMDTTIRDGQQSLWATRMQIGDMLPILPKMDRVGYWAIEAWGGATFDSCLRFLDENPWERLRAIKANTPNTPLAMLSRGQNLVGYKHYSKEIVHRFINAAHRNGVEVFRVFDALNDIRNLRKAVESVKKYGGWAEVALSYTVSPVHTEDYFVKLAADIQKMGADLICIKDMANLLLPYNAYSLVKRLKAEVDIPIVLHTHDTTGTGAMTLLKAIEAGVDVVDTCLSPLGNGTSQPTTESIVATLQGTEHDTGLDLKALTEIAGYFRGVADELTKEGWRDPARVLSTDANTLIYQVPGGMLSNLIGQLKKANAMDKYYDVLAEVPRVRKDFGYPPLVTPTSQIVGTQAVMNVISGERYKMVPKESKALLRGEYGRLPAEVNEEVRKKCIGDDKVITHRPADDIPPELEKYREEIRDYYQQEEDVLSYALFPQVATKFFQYRQAKQIGVDSTMLNKEEKVMPV